MDELRIKVEQLIEDLENETSNRNMNDLEEGRYKTLCEVLDLIDEQYNSGLRLIREMGYRHVSGEPAVKYYCMCNGY